MCLQEGRTIIVVTHEPAVAIWAQRVLVMKDGQLLSEFSAAEFPDPQALAAHYQRIASGISTSVLRNLRSRSHVT
jgi:putative ABC transport system ATP-binding protein